MRHPIVIAIDGPAAAGKGTLAAALAERLGLPYLDTGLLYRTIGKIMAGPLALAAQLPGARPLLAFLRRA